MQNIHIESNQPEFEDDDSLLEDEENEELEDDELEEDEEIDPDIKRAWGEA